MKHTHKWLQAWGRVKSGNPRSSTPMFGTSTRTQRVLVSSLLRLMSECLLDILGGGREKNLLRGAKFHPVGGGGGQVSRLQKNTGWWQEFHLKKSVWNVCLDLVPLRVAPAVLSMFGQGMGVIVSLWVTGSTTPSRSGRWWCSPMRVSCSWPAGLKGCVSGQNDLKLLVSYNPLLRLLGSHLVSVGVSSVCLLWFIHWCLLEVSFALIVPRKLLPGVLRTINKFFFPCTCQF